LQRKLEDGSVYALPETTIVHAAVKLCPYRNDCGNGDDFSGVGDRVFNKIGVLEAMKRRDGISPSTLDE